MLSGVDRSGRVQILEKENLERRRGDVKPETVRLSDEGWRIDVDCVKNIVLRVDQSVQSREDGESKRTRLSVLK